MIPTDLLDQLREKDPELYARFADEDLLEYECSCGYLRTFDASDLIDCAQDAWLLYCIMRAIRARGYGYGMEYYHGPRMVGVSIYKWGNGVEKITIGAGYRTTEAEALLWAYLAALEAKE